jgi:hypothetical protein
MHNKEIHAHIVKLDIFGWKLLYAYKGLFIVLLVAITLQKWELV